MPLITFARNGIYYVRGTHLKQKVYESTGFRDKGSAEEKRRQIEEKIELEAKLGKKATVTFDEAASAYIAAGGSSKYITRHNPDTGKFYGIGEYFKDMKLIDIGQRELDVAAQKLYPKASPETRNRQLYTPFIAVWNYAVRAKWADRVEWKRPKRPKGTGRSIRPTRAGTAPISYDRAVQFVAALSPAVAMAMTTLFYTGMRPIELFALEADQVNLNGRWIVTDSKTGEMRGVPIHEFLVPLLTPLVERGGHLFRSHKGEPWPIRDHFGGQMNSAVDGARERLEKMGIDMHDVSAYTARHTVSTQLVMNGVHPHIKDQILGHAVTSMSRRYTQVPQKELIEAINTLPVPAMWREFDWWNDPVTETRRLVKTGRTAQERLRNMFVLHGFLTCSEKYDKDKAE